MKTRHNASTVLFLAGLLFLLAVGPAAAGSYSPRHLRAESFLKLRVLEYDERFGDARSSHRLTEQARANRPMPFGIPREIAYDHRLSLGSGGMVLRLEAKPKLRRLVRFQVRF